MSDKSVDISMDKLKALASIDDNFSLDPDASAPRDFALLSAERFWEQDVQFRFTQFFGIPPEKLHRSQAEFLGKRRWEMPIFGLTPEQLAEHVATYARRESFRDFEYHTPDESGALLHCSGPQYTDIRRTGYATAKNSCYTTWYLGIREAKGCGPTGSDTLRQTKQGKLPFPLIYAKYQK